MFKRTFGKLNRLPFRKYLIVQLQKNNVQKCYCTQIKYDKCTTIQTADYPPENIRNFSIIAHIDHGKSTLADRLLEYTGTISKNDNNQQILDKLQVERERGITVKAQTASMNYNLNGVNYLLNLIDTPGHVDFQYEVSRSLAACQGVILLIDANQGVQAQTVANFYLAFGRDLVIVPILNKIDLKHANPEKVLKQLNILFDIEEDTVLKISAKKGIGIDEALKAVVERIPCPKSDRDKPFKALLFDSWFERHKGVCLLFACVDGSIKVKDEIALASNKKTYEVKEVGILNPFPKEVKSLYAGQVGYLYCNMKTAKEATIGDTLFNSKFPVEPLAGVEKSRPMIFAGLFPLDQSEHPQLRIALEKLLLNDSSVVCATESSPALGLRIKLIKVPKRESLNYYFLNSYGWRLGFLGLLHMEVFNQRLEQEYDAQLVLTVPNVPIQVKIQGAKNIKQYGTDLITVNNPTLMPKREIIVSTYEPFILGTIITPDSYMGDILSLCIERRGEQKDTKNIDQDRLLLTFKLPLTEVVVDFYDKLKSITSGYASFDYEEIGYEESPMEKLEIFLNGNIVEEMSCLVNITKAREIAKSICAKLKETIRQQQFAIAVQAKVGGKILAREDIRALRKDVAAKLYGGDITRRMKLLKYQAEGKKKMKLIGNIEIPKETFIKIYQR